MAQDKIQYRGNVSISYQRNGKPVILRKHNEGLNAMFKFLCKVVSGNVKDISRDKPAFLDVRLVYTDPELGIQETSCLYNTVSLSNPEYFYDPNIKS